jgi:hypothetical protein
MTNSVFFIEANFGRYGKSFIATDRDSNSRAHVIELIRSGEVNAVKVIEVCEDQGTVRDVTECILTEVAALLLTSAPTPFELLAGRFDHDRKIAAE